MDQNDKTFEGWAIVELMGHRRLGGYVREVEFAGAAMLRLDVPIHPWRDGCTCGFDGPMTLDHEAHQSHCQMFRAPGEDKPVDVYATQFYNAASLYCLTPTTEEMARAVGARPAPVQQWEINRPRYVPALEQANDDDEPRDLPF